MEENGFSRAVEEICARDRRYKPDSYEFAMQALNYTQKRLKRSGHVSGKELAEGMREYALKLYGPMSRTVLTYWGIGTTADLGEIVFNLIQKKVLSKTESDSEADFENVYDFENAFKPVVKDIVL
jgi:uncharacterized repeat protein (TIGR04138 family)